MTIDVKRWYKSYHIAIKYKILLVLAALHDQKIISDEKLNGQFTSLREGFLEGRKGTYHCSINNKWYNDESAEEVFQDIMNTTIPNVTIKFENFVEYIARFERKNYNYGINIFLSEYINKLLSEWNPEYHTEDFGEYIRLGISIKFQVRKYTHECYSCGHSHTTYEKDVSGIRKELSTYFHSLKKGNLSKILQFNL